MESIPLEVYDIIMLVVLVAMTIIGACWGLAWQLASFASFGLSWVVAMRFGPEVAPVFAGSKEVTFWHSCAAILAIYLGTSLAIWIVFRLVYKIIDRVKLKEFDRQMGAMLGLTNGVVLCLVVTFFAVTLSEDSRQAVLKSKSGHVAALIVEKVSPAIPDDVRKVLGKYIEEFDRKLNPTTPAEESLELLVDETMEASGQLLQDQTLLGAGDSLPLAIDPPVSAVLDVLGEQANTLGANLSSAVESGAEAGFFAPNSPFKLPTETTATLDALREDFTPELR